MDNYQNVLYGRLKNIRERSTDRELRTIETKATQFSQWPDDIALVEEYSLWLKWIETACRTSEGVIQDPNLLVNIECALANEAMNSTFLLNTIFATGILDHG